MQLSLAVDTQDSFRKERETTVCDACVRKEYAFFLFNRTDFATPALMLLMKKQAYVLVRATCMKKMVTTCYKCSGLSFYFHCSSLKTSFSSRKRSKKETYKRGCYGTKTSFQFGCALSLFIIMVTHP